MMVTINGDVENALIQGLMKEKSCNSFFMGLRDNTNQQPQWNNGSKTVYKNWNSGEPNDTAKECVQFMSLNGKWNDISCNDNFDCSICVGSTDKTGFNAYITKFNAN